MRHGSKFASWLACGALLGGLMPASAHDAAAPLPRLDTRGQAVQLLVDGKPWIALGGEVHNSTASNSLYMAPVFDKLARLNVNTVVTPVYWELMEPAEGRFDFALVDDQIRQARKHGMRLVLLWFGTLKNAKSTYAPEWVRADLKRFPRAAIRPSSLPFAQGDAPISLFGGAIAASDAAAFARLTAHLAAVDPQHTVIAIQVENETGLLGDSRDRSPAAEAAWNAPVPAPLLDFLGRSDVKLSPSLDALWRSHGSKRAGTWAEVFGTDWQAEEVFMAWTVSRFVDQVSAAGKQKLALPMYTNAWLGPQKADDVAGVYPSGAPVPRVFDVWRIGAPHLDWLAPDIYVDDFRAWTAAYRQPHNPLFIPEARFIVGNLFEALGRHQAIGFSPFGIEDGLPDNQIAEAYALLAPMLPQLAQAQAEGTVHGWALAPGEHQSADFGAYTVNVRGQREALHKLLLDMGVPVPAEAPARKPQNRGWGVPELSDVRPTGLVLQLGPNEFLAVGKDLDITFEAKGQAGRPVELARVEEGRFAGGRWVAERVLNGDERLNILPSDSLGMVRIRLLRPR
jgi:beta-galactosidase GanA